MAAVQKVIINGNEALGVEVDFDIKHESWDEYQLLDGGVIRVKSTVIHIFRVVDEDGQQRYTEDERPMYVVRSKQEVAYRG